MFSPWSRTQRCLHTQPAAAGDCCCHRYGCLKRYRTQCFLAPNNYVTIPQHNDTAPAPPPIICRADNRTLDFCFCHRIYSAEATVATHSFFFSSWTTDHGWLPLHSVRRHYFWTTTDLNPLCITPYLVSTLFVQSTYCFLRLTITTPWWAKRRRRARGRKMLQPSDYRSTRHIIVINIMFFCRKYEFSPVPSFFS